MRQVVLQTLLILILAGMPAGCVDKDAQTLRQADSGQDSVSDSPRAKIGVSTSEMSGNQETDMDRLTRIQDRLRESGLAEYAVIFGTAEQSYRSIVAVDYALFDQFGDDAVACMIIELMLQQSALRMNIRQLPNQVDPVLSSTAILEIDFKAGMHLSNAGFSSDGFGQWLEAENILPNSENVLSEITDSQRSEWFMKGYREALEIKQNDKE